MFLEVGLEDRLNDDLACLLDNSVPDRGNPQGRWRPSGFGI
jgi:hypothetical protein